MVSDYSWLNDQRVFNNLHPKLATYGIPFLMKDHEFVELRESGKEISVSVRNEIGEEMLFWLKSSDMGNLTCMHISMKGHPKERKTHPIRLNPYHFIHLAFVTHFKKGGFNI